MRNEIDIDRNIKFGCEIEFNNTYLPSELNKKSKEQGNTFKIEYDCFGSLIKEAISPILCKDDLEQLKSILEFLTYYNSYIKGNEGAHIHFDHSIVEKENLITMLKMWYLSENVIYEFAKGDSPEMRKCYTMFAQKIGSILNYLIPCYEKEMFNYDNFKMFAKNCGLNLTNYIQCREDKNTIEVRVPNGTLNYDVWLNNIEFFANLFTYSNDLNNKEYIDYLFKKDYTFNSDNICDILYKNDESKKYFKKQISGSYVNR